MTSPLPSPIAPRLTNSIFLRRLICYLMPYFAPITNHMDRAEADILETLAAYGARTRAELLNVVQIIAYSMSGLELLTLAKVDTALSPSLQIRLRGCANNLNRSAQQAEKTLTARLKCDLPTQPETPAEPVPNRPTPNGPSTNSPSTNSPSTNSPLTNSPLTNSPLTNDGLIDDTTPAQTEAILRRIDAQVAAARKPTQPRRFSPVYNAIFADPPPPD